MRLNIKHISLVFATILVPIIFGSSCHALSLEHFKTFSQNHIWFYDPDACDEGTSGGSCGNTAKEIYWSSLSTAFGPVAAAGIFGNIMNEGGFNPVSVESCTENNPFDFNNKTWASGWSEDEFLNGTKTTGVGSFGITSGRNKYFDFIESKGGLDLITKYFTHPEEYSFGGCSRLSLGSSQTAGDALMQKIGDSDYKRLVSLEIEYMQQMLAETSDFDVEAFKNITDAGDAAVYFSMHYEKCAGCTIADNKNGETSETKERRSAGLKAYDEMKDYVCSGGLYKGKGYNYSDEEIKRLVAAAKSENGCNVEAVKDELSIMANLTEERGYDSIIEYIQLPVPPGFFVSTTGAAYRGSGHNSVSDEEFQAAVDVIRNGNRTMPKGINEHDCLGDLTGIDFDGTGSYESFSSWGDCEGDAASIDTSRLKPDVSKIKNKYGSEYTYHALAGGCGDPFGYTKEIDTSNAVGSSGSSSSSSSSSSDSSSKTTPATITLIGDSISVMSETALREKFPDSFLNMVGSRHVSSGGVCSGDEGGITILETITGGTGSIASQHSDSSCEMVDIDSSMLNDQVVWELGANPNGVWDYANNKADRSNIDKAISAIGSKRKLYLVTPYDGSSEESKTRSNAIAQMYRDIAAENDQVYIIEWNNAVAGEENEAKYLSSDHLHPTEEGQKLLADLISQATSSSESCASDPNDINNFTVYYQTDEPWGNESWGGLCTIGTCGCGASAFAMIATALLGQTITPGDTTRVATELGLIHFKGSDENLIRGLADHYHLEHEELFSNAESESTQTLIDKMSEYLRNGWMIEVSGQTPTRDDQYAPFRSTGGHYLAIRGITSDGQWLIGNSSKYIREPMDSYKPWPPESIAKYMHYGVTAIRASGSSAANSSSNCNNICSDSGASSDGGLTAGGMDQAKADAFMAEYRNQNAQEAINKGWIGWTSCNGGPLSNCVAFTQYFINRYTTKPVEGLPNGSDVVGALIAHGFTDGGTTPKPYAVFSTESGTTYCGAKLCGHTGVVLNIDTTKGTILIGEAGCSSDASWTGAHEYSLDKFTSGAYTYAYTDGFLKGL